MPEDLDSNPQQMQYLSFCDIINIAGLNQTANSMLFIFLLQNLPALILKIMRGTFSPISASYSEELRALILGMLHLDPNKRPNINQIMAQPIVINALMTLHTDLGRVPCTR